MLTFDSALLNRTLRSFLRTEIIRSHGLCLFCLLETSGSQRSLITQLCSDLDLPLLYVIMAQVIMLCKRKDCLIERNDDW